MKGRCFAQICLIQQNAIASLNAFSGTSTVTLKMEITSHSLEVQCLGQGDLGPGSSTRVLFVPLHNVDGDNAF